MLNNGSATGSLANLPGGTYQVWAQYAGDGTFAASYSAPQTVTIAPVAGSVNLYGFEVPGQTLNPAAPCLISANQPVYEQATYGGPWSPTPSGTSLSYWQIAPIAIVNGVWPSLGAGSGSVTFSVDGVPQSTVALNSYGYAGWIPPTTFNAGTHTIGATYSGDGSYACCDGRAVHRHRPPGHPFIQRDPGCKLFQLLVHRRCHCCELSVQRR